MNFPRQVKQVLYVEGDADALLLLRLMLGTVTPTRYELTGASTVAESLSCLRQRQYDLVVLSWFYEDGNGIDLCRQIRTLGLAMPILFYSGDARHTSQEAALQAGAQTYLVKPNDLARLVETIERLVQGEGC